jgi:hypothetical protein
MATGNFPTNGRRGLDCTCQTVYISNGSEGRRLGNKQKPRSFFRNVEEPGVRSHFGAVNEESKSKRPANESTNNGE